MHDSGKGAGGGAAAGTGAGAKGAAVGGERAGAGAGGEEGAGAGGGPPSTHDSGSELWVRSQVSIVCRWYVLPAAVMTGSVIKSWLIGSRNTAIATGRFLSNIVVIIMEYHWGAHPAEQHHRWSRRRPTPPTWTILSRAHPIAPSLPDADSRPAKPGPSGLWPE